jgi:hypothetical protein
MKITFENNNRDSIEITNADNGSYRLWATQGTKYREWIATPGEIPTILTFVKQFEALADTMIAGIG